MQVPACRPKKNISTSTENDAPLRKENLPDSGRCRLTSLKPTEILEALSSLDDENLKFVADASFLKVALRVGIDTNPANFATLSVKAMKVLQDNNKSNLLYKFAYCITTSRPGSKELLFPIHRMPFRLVEYQIEFFSSTNVTQVGYFAYILLNIYSFVVQVLLLFLIG